MTAPGSTTVGPVDTDDSGLIDDASGPPRYQQVAAILRQRIEAGELKGKLPPAWQLAGQFGVGESTVKKALDLLRESGHIKSQQGWGSWVPGPRNGPGQPS